MTSIDLRGCFQNNLKGFSLSLPKNRIVLITGVSGCGKSSLAFDTVYAECLRRYLEYLSPQARSWIKQWPKPKIDLIEGVLPALAISQQKGSRHLRGTLAEHTEIYDFISLLYAKIGARHSPKTGKRLIRHTRQEIIELILKKYPPGMRIQLAAPARQEGESIDEALKRLQKMGFLRFRLDGKEILPENQSWKSSGALDVVVDRLEMKEGMRERLGGSVETALDLGKGVLKIIEGKEGPENWLSEMYADPETGDSFFPLEAQDFNFRSPRSVCPACLGLEEPHEKICPLCSGQRLKPAALFCLIEGKNIIELCRLNVEQLLEELCLWQFESKAATVASEILPQIRTRLELLREMGLGYLELDRPGATLSDGEAQRVQLAAQIGSKLSGILYVLDEPSLGLHRQDIDHLISVLQSLKALGNSILLVEHERNLIREADHVVELGPGAGFYGGEILFEGSYCALLKSSTPTGLWLSGKRKFPDPFKRKAKSCLQVIDASLRNLKNLNFHIPLGILVGFCGVSGSGKSTLVEDLTAQQIRQWISHKVPPANLAGYEAIKRLAIMNRQGINYSPLSTPATYIGLMTPLRKLYAETKIAKARGYTSARFSLHKKGGRCEACEGRGEIRIDLDFLPDIYAPCEICSGKRYNYETLQVYWEKYNISDILQMSAADAYEIFKPIPQIAGKLKLMKELGLEYLALGQSFTTLSGGEVQRLRLVADLASVHLAKTLYILDEPSAGLHFQDIEKLILILQRLIQEGHSVWLVEHQLDLLNQADWLIELGPGGGPRGGQLLFEGPPEKIKNYETPTAKALSSIQRR